MRILVCWDEPAEAELISLYLGVDENEVVFAEDPRELVSMATSDESVDIVLISCPREDEEVYAAFCELRDLLPMCPVVGACYPDQLFRVARYLTRGMRSYIPRDTSGDFVFLIQSTLQGMVDAVRAEREKELADRLREEVDSVRKLQESIIPQDLDPPNGYQLCARYEPSQIRVIGKRPVVMAGGDYYDVFLLDENNLVLLVGDASGHGMKACMSIMTMHTLIRMIRRNEYGDTAAFVGEVNRRLCEQSLVQQEGGFITMLYGILRIDKHELEWTSAGHPIPILHRLGDDTVENVADNDSGGLPLGIYEDAEYESHTSKIPAGSRLLLYTDGLVEALATGQDLCDAYGMDGIIRTMQAHGKSTLTECMEGLFDDSAAATNGEGRHDDTSIVFVERS